MQKNFVRQYALNILARQWADGELERDFLRVDAVCALLDSMVQFFNFWAEHLNR